MSGALWAAYFLGKVALHLDGGLTMHFWPNAVLLALVMPFAPRRGAERTALVRRLRAGAGAAAAAALLWYDSFLPPLMVALRFARENPNALSADFLLPFASGFFSARGAAGLAALGVLAFAAARRRLHLTPLAAAALLLVPLAELRRPKGEAARRAIEFFDEERTRRAALPKPAGAPFDVILVQVCSLSWDDLAAAGVSRPRLLEGANWVFSRFNSATSYSGPAALRLLRAPCGQAPHASLYARWPDECRLMPSLRERGFRTWSGVNFPRESMGQMRNVVSLAGADEPMENADLPIRWRNYDGEAVYSDDAVLERWWKARVASGAERAAFYFDTVSLHGGVHEDMPDWWREPKGAAYLTALEELGLALEKLYASIEDSGRSAVVLIVPEHGRATRGSKLQAETLRDIPLTAITRVPAAVRLVGPRFAKAPKGRVAREPVSYLALASLLGSLLEDPSLAKDPARLEAAVAVLPKTAAMSETDSWAVFETGTGTYLRGKDGAWRLLTPDASVAAVSAARAAGEARP